MAGTEGFGDVAVILAALILVADEEADGRAGGFAFEDAGKNFHRIRFPPLGDVARGAGFAAVQFGLDVGGAKGQSRGQPSTTQPMAGPWGFAEGGQETGCPRVLPDIGGAPR